jgi:hypothetical protein
VFSEVSLSDLEIPLCGFYSRDLLRHGDVEGRLPIAALQHSKRLETASRSVSRGFTVQGLPSTYRKEQGSSLCPDMELSLIYGKCKALGTESCA